VPGVNRKGWRTGANRSRQEKERTGEGRPADNGGDGFIRKDLTREEILAELKVVLSVQL
jgi:hypothetical protein